MNVSMLSENLFLLFLRKRYLQVLFYAVISNCDQKTDELTDRLGHDYLLSI